MAAPWRRITLRRGLSRGSGRGPLTDAPHPPCLSRLCGGHRPGSPHRRGWARRGQPHLSRGHRPQTGERHPRFPAPDPGDLAHPGGPPRHGPVARRFPGLLEAARGASPGHGAVSRDRAPPGADGLPAPGLQRRWNAPARICPRQRADGSPPLLRPRHRGHRDQGLAAQTEGSARRRPRADRRLPRPARARDRVARPLDRRSRRAPIEKRMSTRKAKTPGGRQVVVVRL